MEPRCSAHGVTFGWSTAWAYDLCGDRTSIARPDLPCILEKGHAFPHTNKNGGFWNLDKRPEAPNLGVGNRKLKPHDLEHCKHPDCHDEWMRMGQKERKALRAALVA
jgi:hypothetical protein